MFIRSAAFLLFCFQPPACSHSLVSSFLIHLPLTHASLHVSSPFFYFLFPTSLSLFSFLFYLKIAIHLRNHSIFPLPIHSFCLELGQLKATEEKKQKQERVCVSHQITTESEEWGGEKGDNATPVMVTGRNTPVSCYTMSECSCLE